MSGNGRKQTAVWLVFVQGILAALGIYLLQNYALEDHRGQPGYDTWDSDAQSYRDQLPEIKERVSQNAGIV